MNCIKERYTAFIARKMSSWKELALYGLDKYERARGRRNFRRLLLAHPGIAADCGVRALAMGTRRP